MMTNNDREQPTYPEATFHEPPLRGARSLPPEERRCERITKAGARCTGWTIEGEPVCAVHAGVTRRRRDDRAREREQERLDAAREAAMTARERMDTGMEARVPAALAAVDDALNSPNPADRLRAAALILDRLFGKPVAPTEAVEPGSSKLADLRRSLESLPPEDRLAYLRDVRDREREADARAMQALEHATHVEG